MEVEYPMESEFGDDINSNHGDNINSNQCQEDYTDVKTIVTPQSLDELIAELHKVFAHDKVNVEYVKALMTSYKSKRSDWKKYAKFDRHRSVQYCCLVTKTMLVSDK